MNNQGQTDEQLAAQYFRERDYEKAVVLYEKLYETKNNSLYYTYYFIAWFNFRIIKKPNN